MGSFPQMHDPLLLSLQRWWSQSNHFSFWVVLPPPHPQKRTPDHRLLFRRTVFCSRFPPISMWKTVSDRKQCPLIGDRKMMSFMVWPGKKKTAEKQILHCKRGKKGQPVFFFHFHGNSMSFPVRFDVIDVSSPRVPGPQFAAPVRHGTCLAYLDPLRDNH